MLPWLWKGVSVSVINDTTHEQGGRALELWSARVPIHCKVVQFFPYISLFYSVGYGSIVSMV